MMTYDMTSSLHIKNLKTDKFDDFSSDFDFHSSPTYLELLINQCVPRCPKGASGIHKVFASRVARLLLINLSYNQMISNSNLRSR